MALVESLPLTLGSKLPAFELQDPSGKLFSTHTEMGQKGLLVVFTCNHCPYAVAIWERLISVSKIAKEQGINTIAVNPNIHPGYPDDAPDKMLEKIKDWQIPFPYLVDEDQSVALSYQAQCTPDLYLLDTSYSLVYHGRLDDNWKTPTEVKREELKEAIHNFVSGIPVNQQYPSMGCSIKWKK